jgi:toxin-antitoxin system PIN domain toxin
MPLADSNVWMALVLSKHSHHRVASRWLHRQSAREPAYFCRATQQSFLRLLTTREVLASHGTPALTNDLAWSTYQALLADNRIDWIPEPRGLEAAWKRLAATSQASPKLWMDAYLAAFAITGGYQFVTTDNAFRQFGSLDLLLLSKG